MEHSSFAVPLPAKLEPMASREYWMASEPPRALEYLTRRPAGGMFSTADDMAHYMIAHLQGGRYGEQRILREATAQAMHTIQWRGNPDAPGIAIVFYQDVGNGRFVLEHGGDLACQHSQLWLVPSEHLGVFVAFNSTGTDWRRLRAYIWKSLLDRYFPAPAAAEPASATAHQDAQAVAGTYLTTRRFETNFLAITSSLAPTRIIVNPDDTISIDGANRYDGKPRTFRSAGKLLFRETGNTGHTIAFVRGENGKVGLMIVDSVAEFERQTALLDGHTQALLLMTATGVLALSIVSWPVTVLVRRRLARPLSAELDVLARRRRLILKGVTVAALVLIALATLYLLKFAKLELWILSSRLDPLIRCFQLLAVLVMVGTVYAVWVAYIAWRGREGSVLHRIDVTLVGLSLLTLSACLASYHFLTLDLAY
jgi:hypothetical protein